MRNESAKGSRKTKFRLSLAETIFLFLYSDQCLSKSVSENCQSVEGAREERASSPQPSPPEEERERISQTRSEEGQSKNGSTDAGSMPREVQRWHGITTAALNQALTGQMPNELPPLDFSSGT